MNGAVEEGIILRNVVKRPKQDSTAQVLRSDILPMESVHKIVEQLNAGGARFHTNLRVKGSRTKWEPGVSTQLPQPVIAAMVGVALESGMRLSELCALRQEDIDCLRREIRVDAQLSPDGRSRVPTKTKSSIRVIPIADDLLELLDYQVSQSVNGWIFETNRGTPYRATSAGAELRKTVRHLTFEVTFHTFRHMFATTLISSGVSVKQVQTLMGHASATTTLDVYSHFFPGDDDVSSNAIFGVVESPKILRRFSDNSGDTDGDDQ